MRVIANKRSGSAGFTLVEVVIVLVITAILVTVALRSGILISQTGKTEQTKQAMHDLEYAIIGNPSLQNNGMRSDFGYVGDVGSLPPNLDALASNPSAYSTWKGPYVRSRFTQASDGYKRDAWGALYAYTGGVTITSTGSGGNIVLTLGNSTDELLSNRITGSICDCDGTPPGTVYRDSITLVLTVPDGSGGTSTRVTTLDPGGHFAFESVPIGNQLLRAVYLPTEDTIAAFISVTPASAVSNELRFPMNLWGPGASSGSGISPVANSDTVSGGSCNDIWFWIVNTTSSPITITSINISWPSPTAYYARIKLSGIEVFDKDGSPGE